MNFVPCLSWVCRNVAASNPQKLQLPPEDLKRLVDEARSLCRQNGDGDDESEKEEGTTEKVSGDYTTIKEEVKDDNFESKCNMTIKEEADNTTIKEDEDFNFESKCNMTIKEEVDNTTINEDDEDDDFESRYNLDTYDDNDDENPIFTINDLAVHVDNHDDEYITDHESEDELEEKENFHIKESDNLLVVGHVEDDSSVLEIYVYNELEDSFYVHHDIVLPSYPLALEWLDFHPSDDQPGNYIAIGDMTPVIKIWDLDVVDILEPDYVLGKVSKKKKKKKLKAEEGPFHSDAVLSLSWNKHVRNLLASGSADSTIILWDLQEGKGLKQLSCHSNKVQALQWHPKESPFLLSGCTDGFLKVYDSRSDDESKSWKVHGEVERVMWDLTNSFRFFCSTDQGYIHSIDMRNNRIEHSFFAHKEAVTGLDISPERPNLLLSASMDKTVKLWNIENDFHLFKSYKLKVGSIYTARVAPDLSLTVAVGGNNESNSLKVLNIYKDIEEHGGQEQKNE